MISSQTASSGQFEHFLEINIRIPKDWGRPQFHFGQWVWVKSSSDDRRRVGFVDTIYFESEWKYTICFTEDGTEIEQAPEDRIEAFIFPQ